MLADELGEQAPELVALVRGQDAEDLLADRALEPADSLDLGCAGRGQDQLECAPVDRIGLTFHQAVGGEVQVGRELVNLLNLSEKEATRRGDQFIATEMFLLALTEDEGRKAGEAGRVAREAGLQRKALEAAINDVRGGQNVESADAEGQREALKKYTIDLTERARQQKLDPVIGRDDEIRRTI